MKTMCMVLMAFLRSQAVKPTKRKEIVLNKTTQLKHDCQSRMPAVNSKPRKYRKPKRRIGQSEIVIQKIFGIFVLLCYIYTSTIFPDEDGLFYLLLISIFFILYDKPLVNF